MACAIDYRNKLILAPMVRIGTLPSRLLALDHGADLVYSEEIIDFKMLQCERVENALLGTVDFVLKDGTVVFRTCPQEKGKVVFQMGTANAQRALKVARMVEKDVAAVDINMGCPKEFSIKGGMGAALLSEPDKIKDILTTLLKNLSIPVTCKIRILPTVEETLTLARLIESTGVPALAIHGRLKEERPRHDNHNDYIKVVAETLNIPVIANGGSKEISSYADISRFKQETGCSSVMIARAAQWNSSVFRAGGNLSTDTVISNFLSYAIRYDSEVSNVKYCLQQIMHRELDTPRGKALQAAGLFPEICELFGKLDEYNRVLEERKERAAKLQKEAGVTIATGFTTSQNEDGTVVIEMPFVYNKKEFGDKVTPKSLLYEHIKVKRLPNPEYTSIQNPKDRTFSCQVCVEGKIYRSTFSDSSKKYGEQAAAVVCLRFLGLNDGSKTDTRTDRPSWKSQHTPSRAHTRQESFLNPAGFTADPSKQTTARSKKETPLNGTATNTTRHNKTTPMETVQQGNLENIGSSDNLTNCSDSYKLKINELSVASRISQEVLCDKSVSVDVGGFNSDDKTDISQCVMSKRSQETECVGHGMGSDLCSKRTKLEGVTD